ncbi:uncharacterized protein LOC107035727 [Diachasma alloeum]|uniref:uncharacterized protein LOC107035727 n=1 Tax=Diachasma alloeum TaxID=454923 RepID=UPI0007384ECD|nr:uncharacterized protein LOC107035727 [Diachasma alloeum]
MKLIYFCLVVLLMHGVNAEITRKQPQYSKPIYSNSYLPAAMQVIFYAVDQIRNFPPEQGELGSSTTLPTTIPHAPGQHQPTPVSPTPIPTVLVLTQTEKPLEKPLQAAIIAEPSPIITPSTPVIEQKPELSEETPEAVYGTPETNHETPEASQEIQEANQEDSATPNPQENPTSPVSASKTSPAPASSPSEESSEGGKEKSKDKGKGEGSKRREPTIDSVVQEIYGIVKENKSKDSSESKESSEGRGSNDDSEENEGEEYDEDRFTMLGEKVVQVPRPSLLAYLKRARITLRCSLEQLAILYDALSKDARRQGFVKFSGYTDEVLRTLETSAEGGIGPQLQRLLEKIVERKEVTRDDTKAKIAEALKDLKEPGSNLNSDLRRLLPLKFKI